LNLRITAYLFLSALVIGLPFSVIPAQAQQTYSISAQGILWPETEIQINVPSSPAVLSDDLPQAMTIWNNAIAWFEGTFYPSDTSYFRFVSNPNSTMVTFQAVNMQTLQGYCLTGGGVGVCTHYTGNATTGYITSANVEILASELTESNPAHLSLVAAALGTLIGLDMYPEQCPFQDLMCASDPVTYPSTLDLYAAHLVAQGQRVTTATLPASIPYQQAPTLPGLPSQVSSSSAPSTQTVTVPTTVSAIVPTTVLISFTSTATVLTQPQQDYTPFAIAAVVAVGIVAIVVMFMQRREH